MERWLRISGGLLATGVVLGAFGAHGLREVLDLQARAIYEKAVFYQMVHSLGILLVTVLAGSQASLARCCQQTRVLLLGGIVLFSGSLYALAISGEHWLGLVTPIGGLCFVGGWVRLALL